MRAWKCDRCFTLFEEKPWLINVSGQINERDPRWFDVKYILTIENEPDLCKTCRNDMRNAIAERLKEST